MISTDTVNINSEMKGIGRFTKNFQLLMDSVINEEAVHRLKFKGKNYLLLPKKYMAAIQNNEHIQTRHSSIREIKSHVNREMNDVYNGSAALFLQRSNDKEAGVLIREDAAKEILSLNFATAASEFTNKIIQISLPNPSMLQIETGPLGRIRSITIDGNEIAGFG